MQLLSFRFHKDDQISIFFDADKSHPVYVIDIGFHATPPTHCFGPAVREYYLLHFIESGKGTIERNGKITQLQTGDAFLIRPGEITTYRADPFEPWTYYWISFNGSFAKTLIDSATDRLCMPYQKSGLVTLKNTFTQITNTETADIMTLLHTLFSVLESIKPQDAAAARINATDTVTLAMHYMEENYQKDIDVASLAAQLGFSRAYFSTLFQKSTGETPYRYLTKIRLRRACAYLKEDSLSVEEIAYSVGFSSLQRFSEMFKKEYDYSPLQYKKQLLQD